MDDCKHFERLLESQAENERLRSLFSFASKENADLKAEVKRLEAIVALAKLDEDVLK